jgi:hypothetical protein
VKRSVVATALVVTVFMLQGAAGLRGQGWSADVSMGRYVYDPLLTDLGASNLLGTFRYDTRRDTWISGTGAAPLRDGGTIWAAAGAGGRLTPAGLRRRARIGADVGVHGFSFRDRVVDQGGSGGTLEAIPFVRVDAAQAFVEGRAGWRGHTIAFAGVRERRGVFETGARAGYGSTVRVEGDARWVHATEGTYPFVGATVVYDGARVGVWGQVGKWLATNLAERAWGFGAAVGIGARTSVWSSVRQDAPDPLYWNVSRRTWSVGFTQRLGRLPAPLLAVAASAGGAVLVSLDADDAPQGAVSIAGDFNNWQPAPMQREGDRWVARLALAPGVYHYTFRAANGDWFVPASTAGRRDDGMGGHVAVLVVG